MKRAILLTSIYVLAFSGYIFSQSAWTNTGGPEGGAILSLGSSEGKLYGITGSSIYVSSDAGTSWEKIGEDFTNLGVTSVLTTSFGAHFKTTGTIYTTTDDELLIETVSGFGSFEVPTYMVNIEDTLYASGTSNLYKSVDGATTWTSLGAFTIGDILFSDDEYLYTASFTNDIKISRDGGTTFEAFGPDLNFELVSDIKRLGDRVVFSTNTGAWAQDQNGEWTKNFEQPGGFNSLAVIDGIIYGLYSAPTLSADIYASADTGKTWTKVEIEGDIAPAYGDHNKVVTIDGKLYATALQIRNPLVSDDGGLNWSQLGSAGLKNPRTRGLFEIGSVIYATSSSGIGTGSFGDGIFYSEDGGQTWDEVEINLPESHNGLFNTVRGYNGTLYASSMMGLYISTNMGDTWSVMSGTEDWYISDIAFFDDRWVMAGSDGFSRVWTSTDAGATWNAETQAIGAAFFEFYQDEDLITIGSNTTFIGTSTDAGATWHFANADSGLGLINGGHQYVTSLNGTMYAVSSANPEYYSSNDGGKTWEGVDLEGIPAGLSGYGALLNVDGALYLNIQETVFEDGALKGVYSIYKSEDGINYMKEIEFEGMPEGFNFPYLLFTETEIFAGFNGATIHKYDAMETSNEETKLHPERFMLSQNYPNPFNPSTSISFNLPTTGEVSLKVYNMLGQEVATVVEGRLSSGSHTVNFNASQLASGMYIYRLQAGNHLQTKKMMLIK